MTDEQDKTAELIGKILHPTGPVADDQPPAPAEEPFGIDQIIHPLAPADDAAEPLDDQEPYTGPERRAPQVIIAELVEDAPEPTFPPLER
jgi:hypothetical protein